jgi:2,3-bisphosphoglycerate-independent phosphoglycerate mutase
MTQYDASFPYPVLFSKEAPANTLAEVISRAGLRQLHTAETEKYAHVTFFFNGGIEEPYIGESCVLIPSPDVKTYDLKPEMSAPEVGAAVRTAMDEAYDFIVVNFANGDMVGHTGNYEAAKEAVRAVDTQLGLIIDQAKNQGYNIVLTSDHGNCEEMRDSEGNVLTNHTVGEVWCFVIVDGVDQLRDGGGLNNIAPTVLKLMGLEVPEEMDEGLIEK